MPRDNYTTDTTDSSDCLHTIESQRGAYVNDQSDSGRCKGVKGRKLRILYLASDPRSRVFASIKNNKIPQFTKKALDCSLKEWVRLISNYNEGQSDSDKLSAIAEISERMKIEIRSGVNLVLDVAEEDHCIQSSCEIENNPYSILMEYNKFFNVRENEFRKRLAKYKPDILQISGHGSADSLCFCDGTLGESHTRKGIDDIVHDVCQLESQPTLMVITCCHSKALASALLDKTKVQIVIACEGGLMSKNAIEFTQIFYTAIATGKSVEEAYTIATRGKGMYGKQGLQIYKKPSAKEQIRFFSDNGWNDMDADRMGRLSKSNHKSGMPITPFTPIQWSTAHRNYCNG